MKTLFVEYTQVSTIAGLHYAFKTKQSLMGRVVWMTSVAILTFLGFWLSLEYYVQWKESPVLTTITTTGFSHLFLCVYSKVVFNMCFGARWQSYQSTLSLKDSSSPNFLDNALIQFNLNYCYFNIKIVSYYSNLYLKPMGFNSVT